MAALAAVPPPDGRVWVCVRAEDVIASRGPITGTSARNCLCGRVRRVTPEGALVRVDLNVGFPLAARVTRQACVDLGLAPGALVNALVKASRVHLAAVSGPGTRSPG